MRKVLLTLAALAGLGLAGGAAVVFLGLYNVSAQSGHLPGVAWVLHTTFRNAVELRAMPPDEVPDLFSPDLVALGARHYATACAPCHSVPGEARTATIRSMVPEPPRIEEAVAEWQPNELHWIVYNGVKMSGMPAWPAVTREEEVWPVVAYLAAIKEGLTVEEQQALTAPGEAPEGSPPGAAYCSGCHALIDSGVPRLDIHEAPFLLHTLSEYRDGIRQSGIMQQAASRFSPAQLEELAAFYAAMEPTGPASAPPEAGAQLAARGTGDVPACTACHGPGASEARGDFPALAGQDEAFLVTQLRLWRSGERGGSELMTQAAEDLDDAEIEALAAWYAALPPAKGPEAE
ncbi:c-type cytochrome [Pseudoroseicyclus tamaricis]|uniref:C-type cytochrome n=1 Tax=Pseudoroseicyclus tamaricis TaxID=2705421 RepID=A0A6B2K1P3_9RHOB|nr:c-type cytochrome [Pseudoroseicyclus tamaricis]NDV00296.1 c-type cytochrome [Pseudoroseicyclus tamaricis]